ncbi:MAG: septal ring lytic transglycosylase RlpA family protein [Pseudomonadota bacterium]|nr:septal ring lytic transglycosylase RlpA family protein [Pseudomonadota bacterium]
MRPSLAAALAAALLLAGCAGAPQQARAPAGAPVNRGAPHPKTDPNLQVMPAAGSGRGGYYMDDGPGEHPPANLEAVPDAVVRHEPLSKYSNRPYVVFGKTYTPMAADAAFTQRGMASWYGKKFHGQRTSSGELYDMYKMTAAHPTLPIPSYVRVTSVANGQSVVVRINDRGPFHSSRIVDVSYTAALKLGMLGKGSHEVEIERLMPGEPARSAAATPAPAAPAPAAAATPELAALMQAERATLEGEARAEAALASAPAPRKSAADGFFLQLGAYSRADKAVEVRARVLATGAVEIIEVVQAGAIHRLYGGPFASREDALKAGRALPAALAIKPFVVRRTAD